MDDDDSMSSLSKTLLPTDAVPAEEDPAEESGWSIYFEDFMANNQNNIIYNNDEVAGQQQHLDTMSSYFSSSCDNHYECGGSSSLVSDAAFSSAENKCFNVDAQNDKVVQGYPPLEGIKTFKKLSFKKRRKGTLVTGDDLEDTASSPINSPKVSYMNQNGIGMSVSTKDKDHTADFLVDRENKRASLQTTTEKRDGDGLVGADDNSSSSELKKKGLCLVPLSMLMNYLG